MGRSWTSIWPASCATRWPPGCGNGGVPFVFVTAERALGIPREFRDVSLLVKPVASAQIKDVLRSFEGAVPPPPAEVRDTSPD